MGDLTEAEKAWLHYRDHGDGRYLGRRQMRRREFIAGYNAATVSGEPRASESTDARSGHVASTLPTAATPETTCRHCGQAIVFARGTWYSKYRGITVCIGLPTEHEPENAPLGEDTLDANVSTEQKTSSAHEPTGPPARPWTLGEYVVLDGYPEQGVGTVEQLTGLLNPVVLVDFDGEVEWCDKDSLIRLGLSSTDRMKLALPAVAPESDQLDANWSDRPSVASDGLSAEGGQR